MVPPLSEHLQFVTIILQRWNAYLFQCTIAGTKGRRPNVNAEILNNFMVWSSNVKLHQSIG